VLVIVNSENGGSVGDGDAQRGRTELVLVSLSNLYSKLYSISVSISKLTSSSISHYLLTILITNYCSKKTVNNFDLRRLFYSKQGLKNTYHSSIYIDYKWILQYKASI